MHIITNLWKMFWNYYRLNLWRRLQMETFKVRRWTWLITQLLPWVSPQVTNFFALFPLKTCAIIKLMRVFVVSTQTTCYSYSCFRVFLAGSFKKLKEQKSRRKNTKARQLSRWSNLKCRKTGSCWWGIVWKLKNRWGIRKVSLFHLSACDSK